MPDFEDDMPDPKDDFSGLGPFRKPWAERFLRMAFIRARMGNFLLLAGVTSILILSFLLCRHGLPMGDGAAALAVLSPLFLASGGLSLASAHLMRKRADREIVRSIMER